MVFLLLQPGPKLLISTPKHPKLGKRSLDNPLVVRICGNPQESVGICWNPRPMCGGFPGESVGICGNLLESKPMCGGFTTRICGNLRESLAICVSSTHRHRLHRRTSSLAASPQLCESRFDCTSRGIARVMLQTCCKHTFQVFPSEEPRSSSLRGAMLV